MKNKLLLIPSLLLSATNVLAESSVTQAKTRPNIVYILADDLGIGDLGCYGQKNIKTPNIDQLAADGMLFTNHYSGSTVSAPSRCVLLTGKHTGHSYIRGNKPGIGYEFPLEKSETTVADMLKKKEYATACVGKWGMGGPEDIGSPWKHGFDYFFGYLSQRNAHKYYPDFLWENDRKIELHNKVYSHDMILEKALNFIDKNSDGPFFLYFAPTLPHAELTVPGNDFGDYDGKFEEVPFKQGKTTYGDQAKPRAAYAAMVSRLDYAVGEIVKRLQKEGVLQNTIIMFSSDNGVHHEGGHDPEYFNSNAEFRGTKRDLYEGGIRTPFIVRWDNHIAKSTTSGHVSAFWDFMPTIAEVLNIKAANGCDGISFLPTLTGKGEQKKHDYIYHETYEQGGKQSIIKDGWKLIRFNMNHPDKIKEELYCLDMDTQEKMDLADRYPEKVKELRELAISIHTPSKIFKWEDKNKK